VSEMRQCLVVDSFRDRQLLRLLLEWLVLPRGASYLSLRSAPVSASEATTKSDADNSASEGQVMATLKPSGSASTSSSDGR